jgi:hypothetical protein
MRDRTRAVQRNHVGFQRVAVIGGEARRVASGAHDPEPTCVPDCTSHETFISRGQRCIRSA